MAKPLEDYEIDEEVLQAIFKADSILFPNHPYELYHEGDNIIIEAQNKRIHCHHKEVTHATIKRHFHLPLANPATLVRSTNLEPDRPQSHYHH